MRYSRMYRCEDKSDEGCSGEGEIYVGGKRSVVGTRRHWTGFDSKENRVRERFHEEAVDQDASDSEGLVGACEVRASPTLGGKALDARRQ